jgi:hypothetical protein
MEPTLHVRAVSFDGTVQEIDVPESEHMCLADRIAYKRQFGANAVGVIERLGRIFDEDGSKREDADLADLDEEAISFFAWRVLARANLVGDYEAFIASTRELAVTSVEEETAGGDAVPLRVAETDRLEAPIRTSAS